MSIEEKYQKLCDLIAGYGNAAVAFSGGVDSSLLLYAVHTALGKKACAYTAQLAMIPQRETDEAAMFCQQYGIRQTVFPFDAMQIPQVRFNQPERCYFCKQTIFSGMLSLAEKDGFSAVLEGSNADDCETLRPGMRAIRELGIHSPLLEAGLTKAEIRQLSQKYDLPTWNKPALACLASRVPYGTELTSEKLQQIDAAEQFVREMGFQQVRVRLHGSDVRIEIPPDDFAAFILFAGKTVQEMRRIGFRYVSLDLQGYRTGSMEQTQAKFDK